jgi:hypothetical protein
MEMKKWISFMRWLNFGKKISRIWIGSVEKNLKKKSVKIIFRFF